MLPIADLIVYSPEGQLVLVVETKALTETSRDWAAKTRRNMLVHNVIPNGQFLMLALPDRFYLWRDVHITPELVEPSYEIDALPFLQPYYEQAGLSPNNISNQTFKLTMIFWINELIEWGIPEKVPQVTRQSLQDSGLLEALKDGKVVVPAPA